MGETAELRKAVFKLRISDAGRIDADFVLTLCTPEGVEQWDFGWSLQDVVLESARGRSLREMFDPFMRSLFEDHMYDLAQRGLTPDRTYDELPIRVEVPARSSVAWTRARPSATRLAVRLRRSRGSRL